MKASRTQRGAKRSVVSVLSTPSLTSSSRVSYSPIFPHAVATHSSDNALLYTPIASTAGCTAFKGTRLLLLSFSRHKIVIPPLSTLGEGGSQESHHDHSNRASNSTSAHEYEQHRRLSPDVANFIPTESAAEVRRAQQIDAFRECNEAAAQQLWRDSKPHLRKQQKLIDEFGVDGAVRETLQPSRTSFREQLRQRPLDRAILQEIYLGLHGRRMERKLKRGVSWEHWITKGDGTAPVFNTSDKAQQTFAFGGDIKQVRCATHPQQFPVVLSHTSNKPATAASTVSSNRVKSTTGRKMHPHSKRMVSRENLLPEVAIIGRTSSGKSSLLNAIVNAAITPYGHLRGTTDSVRFYNIASRLMIVDCPGYGHYDPIATPAVDAEIAVRAMRAYLACGAAPGALQRRKTKRDGDAAEEDKDEHRVLRESKRDHDEGILKGGSAANYASPSSNHSEERGKTRRLSPPLQYQPRNIKRVLVCVSTHGMQHLDYAYCDLLESYQIPFSVVFTKTDAAPIRFLARLTDYTRSQLVRYTQCKEILLTSSLRIAGIDKVQELLGSFAAADDPLNGATTDFSAIV